LLVVVSVFIVRLRSVEAERLTPLARWVHTVRRSLRRVPNVDQPSLREDLSHPRESATDVIGRNTRYVASAIVEGSRANLWFHAHFANEVVVDQHAVQPLHSPQVLTVRADAVIGGRARDAE